MENNIKVGTTFYHKDNKDLIYTMSSFDSDNVKISWGKMNNVQYSLDSVLNNIKDKTWIITMEKKIIGYKLTKPEYEKAANQITGAENLISQNYNFQIDSIAYDRVVKAGVLDLWFEPVYKEEFKVGDWVTTTTEIANCYEKYKKGEVFQLTEIQCEYVYFSPGQAVSKDRIRKATEEEIKKAQSIEIGGYGVKINSIDIEINNVSYSKNDLIVLKHLFKQGQIKSLNVGCSGQYTVDLELLEKIIDKF